MDTTKCLEGLAALAGVSLGERTEYDWAEIEADLGLRLPADYKALAAAYRSPRPAAAPGSAVTPSTGSSGDAATRPGHAGSTSAHG